MRSRFAAPQNVLLYRAAGSKRSTHNKSRTLAFKVTSKGVILIQRLLRLPKVEVPTCFGHAVPKPCVRAQYAFTSATGAEAVSHSPRTFTDAIESSSRKLSLHLKATSPHLCAIIHQPVHGVRKSRGYYCCSFLHPDRVCLCFFVFRFPLSYLLRLSFRLDNSVWSISCLSSPLSRVSVGECFYWVNPGKNSPATVARSLGDPSMCGYQSS